MADVTPVHISYIFRGMRRPSWELAGKLSEILQVDRLIFFDKNIKIREVLEKCSPTIKKKSKTL